MGGRGPCTSCRYLPASSSSIFRAFDMYSKAFLWWCFCLESEGSPGPMVVVRTFPDSPRCDTMKAFSSSGHFFFLDIFSEHLWKAIDLRLLHTNMTSTSHNWAAIARITANNTNKGVANTRTFCRWKLRPFFGGFLDWLSYLLRPNILPLPRRCIVWRPPFFYWRRRRGR